MSVPGNGEQTLDSSCPLESASGKIHSSELEGKGNKSKKGREEKEPPQVKRTLSAREKFFSESMQGDGKSESKNVDSCTSHLGSPSKIVGLNYGTTKKNTSRLPTPGSSIPSKISSSNISKSRIPQKDHVKTEIPSKTDKYSDMSKRDVNLKPANRLMTISKVDKLQEMSDIGKKPETSRELPKPMAGKATVSSLPIGTVKTKEQGRIGSSLIPASSGSSLSRLSQSPSSKKGFGESKLKQPSGSLNRFGYMKPAEKSSCLSVGQTKYSKSCKVASDGEKGLDISLSSKKPQNCRMETGIPVADLVEVKEKIRKVPGEQGSLELTGVHIGDANVETVDVNTIEVKGDLMDDCKKEKEKVNSLGSELEVVSEISPQNDSTDMQNKLALCTKTCGVSSDENDATREEEYKTGETLDHGCGRTSVLDSTETNSSELKMNEETNGADHEEGVNIQTSHEKSGDPVITRDNLSDSECMQGDNIDEKPMLKEPLVDTIENGIDDIQVCNLQREGKEENEVKYNGNNMCNVKENELVKEPDVVDFGNEKEIFKVCNPKKRKDKFCEAMEEDNSFSNQANQNMSDHEISTREDHKETLWNKRDNSKSDILVKKHEEKGVTEENSDLYEVKRQQSETTISSDIVGMESNEDVVPEGEDIIDSKRVIEILYNAKHLELEDIVGDDSSRKETSVNRIPEVEKHHMDDKEEIESNVTSIKEVKQDRKQVVKTNWEAQERNSVWRPEAEDKVKQVEELGNLCKQPVENEKIGLKHGGQRKSGVESLSSSEEPLCKNDINDYAPVSISLKSNPEDESSIKEGDSKTVRRVEEKNDVVSTTSDSPSKVKSNKVSRFIQMFSRNSGTASSAVDGSNGIKRNSSSSSVQEYAVSTKNKDEKKTDSRNQSSAKKIWQPYRSQSLKEKYVSKSAKAKDDIIKEHKQKGEEGNSENCDRESQNEDEIVVPKGQVAARRSKFEAATQGCRTYFSQCIIMPTKNKKHRKKDSKTEDYCVTEMQPQSSSSELFTQVCQTKTSEHPEKPQSTDKQDDFSKGKFSMQRCHDSFDDDFIFHTEDKETGLFSKIDEELCSYLTGVNNEVKETRDNVNGKLYGHNQELISIDNFKCNEEMIKKISPNENSNENSKIGSDLPVCHLSLKPTQSPYRKTSLLSHEQPDSQELDWISEGLCSEVLETLEKSSDSLVITDDNQNDPLSGENVSDSLVDVGQLGGSLESDSDAVKQGIELEDPCQSHVDVEFKFCGGGSKVGALVSRFENNHIND